MKKLIILSLLSMSLISCSSLSKKEVNKPLPNIVYENREEEIGQKIIYKSEVEEEIVEKAIEENLQKQKEELRRRKGFKKHKTPYIPIHNSSNSVYVKEKEKKKTKKMQVLIPHKEYIFD